MVAAFFATPPSNPFFAILTAACVVLAVAIAAWTVIWTRSVYKAFIAGDMPGNYSRLIEIGIGVVMLAVSTGSSLGYVLFLRMWIRYMFGPKLKACFGPSGADSRM